MTGVFRKTSLLILGLFFMGFISPHKYYVSVTEVDYASEEKALQISSRLFIDDLENLLKERYDEGIALEVPSQKEHADHYIKKYFEQKLQFEVNNKRMELNYVGREFEDDMVYCYFEILNVNQIKTLKVTNRLLFDLYSDQQNITHMDINRKKKSFLLIRENDNEVLNF